MNLNQLLGDTIQPWAEGNYHQTCSQSPCSLPWAPSRSLSDQNQCHGQDSKASWLPEYLASTTQNQLISGDVTFNLSWKFKSPNNNEMWILLRKEFHHVVALGYHKIFRGQLCLPQCRWATLMLLQTTCFLFAWGLVAKSAHRPWMLLFCSLWQHWIIW